MPSDDWDDDGPIGADRAYNSLPGWVRDDIEDASEPDEVFKELFGDLFGIENGRVDWDEAQRAHDELQQWMWDKYGIELDDYFNWDDWRDNYDANAA